MKVEGDGKYFILGEKMFEEEIGDSWDTVIVSVGPRQKYKRKEGRKQGRVSGRKKERCCVVWKVLLECLDWS